MSLREDQSRVRTGAAPEVLTVFRNIVLALLRATKHQHIASALRTIAWSSAATALAYLGLAVPDN